ncbi:OPT family oligopeptide transporter [Aeoliella sp. SH292]|uniref:OPT family oligopeptide transporter n=1 Tax=Aeoliella sp. SH292 TaxID=3454464 RepID=UPI003F9A6F50
MDSASPYQSPQADEVVDSNSAAARGGGPGSEPQLTWRAVLVGCLVGSVISCTNMYIGLKIGWTFGASIIAAVLGFSFFALINRRLSILETNIAQTAGSAAGYMSSAAGLVAAIPALEMLGYKIEPIPLVCWSLSIAFLGVFFAVPLRRQMILVDKLQFPSGTATAETILAMYSDADEAMGKARVLLWSGLLAGLFTLGYHFVPQLESPPLHEWIPLGFLTVIAGWGFTISLGPSLVGAGFLVGPRVVLSLLAGCLLAWGVLGPWAQQAGWAPGAVMSYADGPRGWLLWPGVALMVSEALASVALSWRTFVDAIRGAVAAIEGDFEDDRTDPTQIPNSWWMGGLALGTLLTMVIAYWIFEIPWYLTLVAVALSSVLSVVAVRSAGETDINPVGGMGKVTQLVFGGLAPGAMSTNLMCAAITGAGASQAADMMQDLKTGHLLGASPRNQFFAQLAGILAGVVFVVPAYYLFNSAYEIGGEELPAPAAHAWKAMAELLADGFGALPPHSEKMVLAGAVLGVLFAVLRRVPSIRNYVPSGLAMGIAFIVPAFNSLSIVIGLAAYLIWKAVSPQSAKKYDFAVASGLIAGEGLMGAVNAGLTIAGIGPLT